MAAVVWELDDCEVWLILDETASPEENAKHAAQTRAAVMRRNQLTGKNVKLCARLRMPQDRIENAA